VRDGANAANPPSSAGSRVRATAQGANSQISAPPAGDEAQSVSAQVKTALGTFDFSAKTEALSSPDRTAALRAAAALLLADVARSQRTALDQLIPGVDRRA
jgi:hypothetical protein